jgi:uncharacterized protein YbjT (DUF2867 family)
LDPVEQAVQAEAVRLVRGLAGAVAVPDAVQTPIDLGDIAAVARVVLLDESYTGPKFMMSGPEAITQPEEVEAIRAAIGREVKFEALSREEALELWTPLMGAETAEWLLDGFRMMSEWQMTPEPTVLEVTGRPALTYREWARRNADAFR